MQQRFEVGGLCDWLPGPDAAWERCIVVSVAPLQVRRRDGSLVIIGDGLGVKPIAPVNVTPVEMVLNPTIERRGTSPLVRLAAAGYAIAAVYQVFWGSPKEAALWAVFAVILFCASL